MVISRSSVPQATQSSRMGGLAFPSRPGKSLSNGSGSPPELKAPIQANLSRLLRPVSSDSDPPIDTRKIFVERLRKSSRTEGTNPGKLVEIIETGEQRFRPAHR